MRRPLRQAVRGGVVVVFNMNPGKPTKGWNQIMTLPRRLTLVAKDELGIEPAGDIESLRYDHQHVDAMTLPANQEVVLENVRGNAMEIIAEIDPKNAPMVEMNVLRSANSEEVTRIMFFKNRAYDRSGWPDKRDRDLITIDSSRSSLLPDVLSRAPETAQVFLDDNEPLKLRVFIDRSVVEVFVNGKQCVALRVYPGREDSVGVSLRSQGQDAALKSLDAWQMKNIYERRVFHEIHVKEPQIHSGRYCCQKNAANTCSSWLSDFLLQFRPRNSNFDCSRHDVDSFRVSWYV